MEGVSTSDLRQGVATLLDLSRQPSIATIEEENIASVVEDFLVDISSKFLDALQERQNSYAQSMDKVLLKHFSSALGIEIHRKIVLGSYLTPEKITELIAALVDDVRSKVTADVLSQTEQKASSERNAAQVFAETIKARVHSLVHEHISRYRDKKKFAEKETTEFLRKQRVASRIKLLACLGRQRFVYEKELQRQKAKRKEVKAKLADYMNKLRVGNDEEETEVDPMTPVSPVKVSFADKHGSFLSAENILTDSLRHDIEDLRGQIKTKDHLLEMRSNAIAHLEIQVDKIRASLATKMDEIISLERANEALRAANERIAERVLNENDHRREEIEALQSKLKTVNRELAAEREKSVREHDKHASLSSALEYEFKMKMDLKEEELKDARDRLRDSKSALKTMMEKYDLKKMDAENKDLRNRLVEKSCEVERLEECLEQLRKHSLYLEEVHAGSFDRPSRRPDTCDTAPGSGRQIARFDIPPLNLSSSALSNRPSSSARRIAAGTPRVPCHSVDSGARHGYESASLSARCTSRSLMYVSARSTAPSTATPGRPQTASAPVSKAVQDELGHRGKVLSRGKRQLRSVLKAVRTLPAALPNRSASDVGLGNFDATVVSRASESGIHSHRKVRQRASSHGIPIRVPTAPHHEHD